MLPSRIIGFSPNKENSKFIKVEHRVEPKDKQSGFIYLALKENISEEKKELLLNLLNDYVEDINFTPMSPTMHLIDCLQNC